MHHAIIHAVVFTLLINMIYDSLLVAYRVQNTELNENIRIYQAGTPVQCSSVHCDALQCTAVQLQLVPSTAVQLQLVEKTAVHCSALHPLHHHTTTLKMLL